MKVAKTVAVAVALSTSMALAPVALAQAANPSLISYDLGSLDTLDALDLSAQVKAVPKQSLPEYLSHYASDEYADAGSLKSPDVEAIRKLRPDLVLVTGRQGEIAEEIRKVATVKDVSMPEGEFADAVSDRVMRLAERYGAEDQAQAALKDLWIHTEKQQLAIQGKPEVLVVTHNSGSFSQRQEPVVAELLKLPAPAVPEQVEPVTRGTRTFIPLTAENMVAMAPDVLLIVDRSAAIGDEPLDRQKLIQDLAAQGGKDIKVEVLSPGLWYLSGGGLQSVRLQVDEVVAALQ
ncbi:ABC transporter substrate-binding protein [Hydrocarboniclastica marina]|uniref:ABC transporter substrate-binding protein n=1 Tax=Hydrocarboniclastica marina TaxID=2259620 RepID=A0A4P7XK40_9ALTE|nr:ABC transporter substrate-binding protein [Hydrocarboniclastica marina]MAM00215.1 ABC transporter substrate-binding protein [Alteromonadaceae bacterium]QCF27549.1 ABC transporter substrate-binding protein [Hydrocarboniclastica marina]|tara:strand:+ start:2339 stop:3211 length:873 start_codon:yes stop_codon:yes gene_type:complete